MTDEADVVVVGGGLIGLAAAGELADAGANVVLLEAEAELGQGCSYGNAGLICPSHSTPLATGAALREGLRWVGRVDGPLYLHPTPRLVPWLMRFALACRPHRVRRATDLMLQLTSESFDLFRKWAARGRDFGFASTGILNVYETSAGLTSSLGDQLDAHQVMTLEPSLAPTIAGGVLHADEAYCDPARLIRELAERASAQGVTVRKGVQVGRVSSRNGSAEAHEVNGKVHRAAAVVLATGVATRGLARTGGVSIPLEGGKGYHLDLARGAGDPSRPVFLQEARVVVTPFPDRIRVSGTLEFGAPDGSVSPRRIDVIRRHAERVLPVLRDRTVLGTWAGFRPCAPDSLPIVGRALNAEGLVIATGHAMLGLTLAPITGRLVRQIVLGERTSLDIALLAPSRFQ